VLVTIVVDQLAGWVAAERWPELPADGGFARLRREGTWIKDMRYAHAATDTAPGHSALYTGVTPRESGIFANELPAALSAKPFPRDSSRRGFLVDDSTRIVTEDGVGASPGSSLAKLKVDTLADILHRKEPNALVLSFSLKDRGALFGGGRSPRASLWFDPKTNRLASSTAITRSLPAWALPIGSSAALARVESQTWNLLDPTWVKAHARTPDDQPGEGDEHGLGVIFPHVLASVSAPGYGLRTSPFADDLLFSLALAGIDGENAAGHQTLIAISLSSNDYVGHVFGPDSWEAWDEIERLDRSLGHFLSELDVRFGPNGYAVLLTADHGVTTMPEAARVPGVRAYCEDSLPPPRSDPWERACASVGRLIAESLADELRAATETALGPGAWIAGVVDPYVYLTDAARALDRRKRDLLDDAVGRALRSHPEVDHVTPTRALSSPCPPESDESVAALVCRSVPANAGDYYVVTSRGSFFDADVVVGKGSSHGSPYLFDRSVPLLARAPGRVAAGVVVERPASYETFARAAGGILGIDAPGHADRGTEIVLPK
jgi:hypothetical protein